MRGFVSVLLALTLLAFASVAAGLVHRSVVREWAMEGEALQGARASLAADSALAWFLATWRAPDPPADHQLAVPEAVLPPGPHYRQEGEVRVRFLGGGPGPEPLDDYWKVTLEGRVRVVGGGRARATYRQVREAYVVTPKGRPGAPPVLAAWRIIR